MSLLNETKIILDLCGGTGAWSKPYKDAGYDVRVITLPEQNIIDYIPPAAVYGVLAAPPCTEFSLARNRYNEIKPRNFVKGMIPVNACIRIVYQTNPYFFALENPVGMLSNFLGKAKYTFHPWWFGDPYSKFTALWGYFNLPQRKYSKIEEVVTDEETIKKLKDNIRRLPSISEFPSGTQAERRAITPAGFAQAFFEANP